MIQVCDECDDDATHQFQDGVGEWVPVCEQHAKRRHYEGFVVRQIGADRT